MLGLCPFVMGRGGHVPSSRAHMSLARALATLDMRLPGCGEWACWDYVQCLLQAVGMSLFAAGLNPRQPNTKCATVKIASPANDPTTVPLMRMY